MIITKERMLHDALEQSRRLAGKCPKEVDQFLTLAYDDGEISGFLMTKGALAYWHELRVQQEEEERKRRQEDPEPTPVPSPSPSPSAPRLSYYESLMLMRVGKKRLRDCTRDDLLAWAVSLDRIAVDASIKSAWARRIAANMHASQRVRDLDPTLVEGLVRRDFAEAAE